MLCFTCTCICLSSADIIYTERACVCNPFIDVIIYHLYFKADLASGEASGKINFPTAGVDTGMNSCRVSALTLGRGSKPLSPLG